MTDWIRFAISAACTLFSLFVLISSVVGIYKFKTPFNRLHSASIIDTVGILTMIAGVIVAEGIGVAAFKRVLVVVFLWFTSPVASHLIARLEVTENDELDQNMEILDREMVEKEREGD